ncbi:MAG TPA: DUF2934 domain-containing protein [Burkholderiaceae bacterium]|nr:DUF2934 domain-containing protein [Burkholderiaceae bacterium]
MSTARRKTSDDAATPPRPAVKRSPATRGTVDRKTKTTTVAADAADVKKAAATKAAAAKPAPAGTKAAPGAAPAAASRPATARAAEPAAERADMIIDRETMIRERAYLRYLERGGGSGEAVADWLAAEREVDAEFTRRGAPA